MGRADKLKCQQCQTKHTYNANCDECAIRLIISTHPMNNQAKTMTHYIKTHFNVDFDLVVKTARQQWKIKKGDSNA